MYFNHVYTSHILMLCFKGYEGYELIEIDFKVFGLIWILKIKLWNSIAFKVLSLVQIEKVGPPVKFNVKQN